MEGNVAASSKTVWRRTSVISDHAESRHIGKKKENKAVERGKKNQVYVMIDCDECVERKWPENNNFGKTFLKRGASFD